MSKARQLADNGAATPNRNLVINGAMNVAQRATSVTGIGASDGYFTIDRFKIDVDAASAGRLTMTQTADGPSGFANCLKLDCTTADTSIAAGERLILRIPLEGQNLQRMKKGTSDAEQVTISFYVKGNASATYSLSLYDNDNGRTISQTFAVTTAWNRIELTFAGDTTGALGDDNNASLLLDFFLHAGSTYTSGSLGTSWASNNNATRAVGISSFFDATSRTFFMTGLQMEIGSSATPFEHKTFGQDLEECSRYYSREEADTGASYKRYATGSWSSSTGFEVLVPLSTPMRTTPTLETTGTAANYAVYSANSIDASTGLAITNDSDAGTNNRAVAVAVTTSGGGVAGEGGTLLNNNNTAGFIALNAEL